MKLMTNIYAKVRTSTNMDIGIFHARLTSEWKQRCRGGMEN